MKKFLVLLFLMSYSLIFSSNVYFDYPSNNSSYASTIEGRASFTYCIMTVSSYFIADIYRTIIQYPDGSWSGPQDNQTGGWAVTKAGTYHLQGLVHVVYDMGGSSDYWMSSNILTIYITDSYAPSAPQNLSMSSNSGQYGNVRLDWTANTEYDLSYYEIRRYMEEEEWRGWEMIGTTTNTYFVDSQVLYAPNGGLEHGHYKIRAVDINNNYSNYSVEVTERVEPLWNLLPGNSKDVDVESFLTEKEVPAENSITNYPNPFNPTTTINYQLPQAGFVTIKVFDMLGKEVAVLVNENKSAGYYKVDFNASKLTSGVYIYTITTNNFSASKKIMLMK